MGRFTAIPCFVDIGSHHDSLGRYAKKKEFEKIANAFSWHFILSRCGVFFLTINDPNKQIKMFRLSWNVIPKNKQFITLLFLNFKTAQFDLQLNSKVRRLKKMALFNYFFLSYLVNKDKLTLISSRWRKKELSTYHVLNLYRITQHIAAFHLLYVDDTFLKKKYAECVSKFSNSMFSTRKSVTILFFLLSQRPHLKTNILLFFKYNMITPL